MTESTSPIHLTELELEIAAAGRTPPHAETCARCTSRIAGLLQSNAEIRSAPEFARRGEALGQLFQKQVARRWTLPALATASGLAAAVVLASVWLRPATVPNLIKGTPTLEVVSQSGGRAPFHVGDRVHVRAGGAGHSYGIVLGLSADCRVEVLWPANSPTAGQVEGVGDLGVFEVTPDPMRVWALFFDAPSSVERTRQAVSAEAARACASGPFGLDWVPPPLADERGRATELVR